jgi:hypothetical protein
VATALLKGAPAVALKLTPTAVDWPAVGVMVRVARPISRV